MSDSHFTTIVLQLHAKFQKDPMTGYREKLRTNERTDGRTDMGQSIGPTSKVGGSKKLSKKDQIRTVRKKVRKRQSEQ